MLHPQPINIEGKDFFSAAAQLKINLHRDLLSRFHGILFGKKSDYSERTDIRTFQQLLPAFFRISFILPERHIQFDIRRSSAEVPQEETVFIRTVFQVLYVRCFHRNFLERESAEPAIYKLAVKSSDSCLPGRSLRSRGTDSSEIQPQQIICIRSSS